MSPPPLRRNTSCASVSSDASHDSAAGSYPSIAQRRCHTTASSAERRSPQPLMNSGRSEYSEPGSPAGFILRPPPLQLSNPSPLGDSGAGLALARELTTLSITPGGGGRMLLDAPQSTFTPEPVVLDIPSPSSFNPLLEHFLRAPQPEHVCVCVLERHDGGKSFNLNLEEGNVPLLTAKRTSRRMPSLASMSDDDAVRGYRIFSADGHHFATLAFNGSDSFFLRSATNSSTQGGEDMAYACFFLYDRDYDSIPGKPRLNVLAVSMTNTVCNSPPFGGSVRSGGFRMMRGSESVANAAAYASSDFVGFKPPSPELSRDMLRSVSILSEAVHHLHDYDLGRRIDPPEELKARVMQTRQPVWDEKKSLLTLDFPQGRANLASHQNFQLSLHVRGDGLTLVHGLMSQEGTVERFSLDFWEPLSPLVALCACLASQEWR